MGFFLFLSNVTITKQVANQTMSQNRSIAIGSVEKTSTFNDYLKIIGVPVFFLSLLNIVSSILALLQYLHKTWSNKV